MAGQPTTALPCSRTATGIRLKVRLTPRGGSDVLAGIREDEFGQAQLLGRVGSPPIDGAANAALIKLVAKSLRVSKSAVTIAAGETARVKVLNILGDPASLERAVEALI
jgi:uncharacterized protein YggU (UPF0235/DUF167 family)